MADSIKKIWGLEPPIDGQIVKLAKAKAFYGEIKTYFGKYKNPIGIELEIENVPREFFEWSLPSNIRVPFYWKIVEDGSLRNKGMEFVSVPLAGHNIDYAIHEVARCFENTATLEYSVRTSCHVHLNVSEEDDDFLVRLTAMYALFEPLFFSLTESRLGNPFCYPISDHSPKDITVQDQIKYCAFNVAPVRHYGTVEFRHLQGTRDWRLLRRWCQIICKLFVYCKSKTNEQIKNELAALDTKNYDKLLTEVFGMSSVLFKDRVDLEASLIWAIIKMETN